MMATPTAIIVVTLLTFCPFSMYSSASESTHYQYPIGSLACKAYDMTKMDCSHRNLVHLPEFESNLTDSLDLSHNLLKNISGAPFEKQHFLLLLDMQWNGISELSPMVFKGLYSLRHLDLYMNQLTQLPQDIFSDLSTLQYLNIGANFFTEIPGREFMPLNLLHDFYFFNHGHTPTSDLNGFQNLSTLYYLELYFPGVEVSMTKDIFTI